MRECRIGDSRDNLSGSDDTAIAIGREDIGDVTAAARETCGIGVRALS